MDLKSIWAEIEPYVQVYLADSDHDLDLTDIALQRLGATRTVTSRQVREVLTQAAPADADVPDPVPARIADPALSQRMDELKLRYIVGKVAGKDLVDGHGQIIVPRGERLTSAVVEAADRAGKLVELIVNMVIDDLGE